MNDTNNDTRAKRRPVSEGIDDEGNDSEPRVYGICLAVTAVWVFCGVAYFLYRPVNFLRMWPHEFGSLLSGWASPLAALWVFAAVLLQRAQLKGQRIELRHTSEALRRSVEDLERNALATQLTRLSERMMHGVLRLARTGGAREFYLSKQGQRIRLAQLFGSYRRYVDLYKADEVSRALERLGSGIGAMVSRIKEDWVLHADGEGDLIEELCIELSLLGRIIDDIQELTPALAALNKNDGAPEKAILEGFRKQVIEANETLDVMLHDSRTFDLPEGPSQV